MLLVSALALLSLLHSEEYRNRLVLPTSWVSLSTVLVVLMRI
jgi:hypothetical protein